MYSTTVSPNPEPTEQQAATLYQLRHQILDNRKLNSQCSKKGEKTTDHS